METYSVTSDFGGVNPNLSQITIEINENVTITTNCLGCIQEVDIVNILFDSTISVPEKTELDSVVGAHIPVFIPHTPNKFVIIPMIFQVRTTTFRRVALEIFPGSTYATGRIISFMDSDVTSYDVEIFDKTNHVILSTTNLTNTGEEIMDLGELVGISTNEVQLEISIRKNGGSANSKITIETMNILHV